MPSTCEGGYSKTSFAHIAVCATKRSVHLAFAVILTRLRHDSILVAELAQPAHIQCAPSSALFHIIANSRGAFPLGCSTLRPR